MWMRTKRHHDVPAPRPAPDEDQAAHPLTLFVSGRLRRQILEALRTFDADRVRALCLALGVEPDRDA